MLAMVLRHLGPPIVETFDMSQAVLHGVPVMGLQVLR